MQGSPKCIEPGSNPTLITTGHAEEHFVLQDPPTHLPLFVNNCSGQPPVEANPIPFAQEVDVTGGLQNPPCSAPKSSIFRR